MWGEDLRSRYRDGNDLAALIGRPRGTGRSLPQRSRFVRRESPPARRPSFREPELENPIASAAAGKTRWLPKSGSPTISLSPKSSSARTPASERSPARCSAFASSRVKSILETGLGATPFSTSANRILHRVLETARPDPSGGSTTSTACRRRACPDPPIRKGGRICFNAAAASTIEYDADTHPAPRELRAASAGPALSCSHAAQNLGQESGRRAPAASRSSSSPREP